MELGLLRSRCWPTGAGVYEGAVVRLVWDCGEKEVETGSSALVRLKCIDGSVRIGTVTNNKEQILLSAL